MSLKLPNLFNKNSAYEFFNEFLKINAQSRGFTQRSFSQKLGWPVSYLPDLMKKRKPFTIKRAVEFGKYFHLNPIDFEKLIYLAILDSGLIEKNDIQKITSTKSSDRKKPTKDLELLSAAIFIIYEAIRWLHGKATLEIIHEIAAKNEISTATVQSTISLLSKKNLIEKRGNKFLVLGDFLISDDVGEHVGTETHRQFMELQAKFFMSPTGPAIYNSAIVHIDRSRFEEIADKIVALRNWIFEISKYDSQKHPETDVRLFQLNMNLTPLLDKDLSKKLRKN